MSRLQRQINECETQELKVALFNAHVLANGMIKAGVWVFAGMFSIAVAIGIQGV